MPNPAPKLLTERVPLLLSAEEVGMLDALRDGRGMHSRNTLMRTLLRKEASREAATQARRSLRSGAAGPVTATEENPPQ